MHFRLRQRRADVEPVFVRARPDALVGELAAALGHDPDARILIDGRPTRSQDELRDVGLCQGSVVTAESTSNRRAGACSTILSVRNGLGAGRTLVLDRCERTIGRSAACDLVLADPTVELLHATAQLSEGDTADTAVLHLLADPTATARLSNRDHLPPVGQDGAARDTVVIAVGQRVTLGCTELELLALRPEDRLAGTDTASHAAPALPGPRRSPGDHGGVASGRGTVLLNRPPRVGAPRKPEPLEPPRRPPPSSASPLAVAAVVLPLMVAAVLVTITGSWLFAVLTVLSPLLAVANWWSSRRTQRRQQARSGLAFARQLRVFEHQARTLRQRHDQDLAARSVHVGELVRRARLPARSLWERRPADEDGLRVLLGWADCRWSVPLATTAGLDEPAVAAILARVQQPQRGPVELGLGRDRVIGLVGDRDAARAVARSLMLQLAVHHGPSDLAALAVVPRSCRAWDWLDWLPHVLCHADPAARTVFPATTAAREGPIGPDVRSRSTAHVDRAAESAGSAGSAGSGRATGSAGAAELARRLRRAQAQRIGAPGASSVVGGDPDAQGPHLLVVVEDEDALLGRGSPVRNVLRGGLGPAVALVLASSPDRLPASCGLVIEVSADGTGRLRTMADGSVVDRVALMGAPAEVALDIAASLARFEDPELAVADSGVPGRVGLLELLLATSTLSAPVGSAGVEADLAHALRRSWAASAARGVLDELPAVIGAGAHGPTMVDLVADGPHALVAGTTGAGKSELLRSWIVSMAAATSPEWLNFVLIDFKGGSAFDACAQLPHTVAVVTDLDADLAERALRCLQAELAQRERVLRAAGVSDIAELGHKAPGTKHAQLARLVVIIDEFATLAAELPGFVDSLVGIAQRGRSLGLHLILATQRPAGVLNDNIRANTNIRIALRVQDRADSLDVIEQPDAANLDRQRPGRAMVRLGRNELTETQSAFSGALGVPVDLPAVQRLDQARPDGPISHPVQADPGTQGAPVNPTEAAGTDLERLVVAARSAARALRVPPPRVPWPPALPEVLGWLERPSGADQVAAPIPFLLVDDPDRQAQHLGGWDPARGNLAVFGAAGSGVSTALVAVCLALAERHDPHRLAMHILGDDPAFATLARLPQVVNLISRNDRERFGRLLGALEAEIVIRRGNSDSAAASGAISPGGVGHRRARLDPGRVVRASGPRSRVRQRRRRCRSLDPDHDGRPGAGGLRGRGSPPFRGVAAPDAVGVAPTTGAASDRSPRCPAVGGGAHRWSAGARSAGRVRPSVSRAVPGAPHFAGGTAGTSFRASSGGSRGSGGSAGSAFSAR